MALRSKVECLCYNETKTQQQNNIFNFVSSQIDFIQYKFDH